MEKEKNPTVLISNIWAQSYFLFLPLAHGPEPLTESQGVVGKNYPYEMGQLATHHAISRLRWFYLSRRDVFLPDLAVVMSLPWAISILLSFANMRVKQKMKICKNVGVSRTKR